MTIGRVLIGLAQLSIDRERNILTTLKNAPLIVRRLYQLAFMDGFALLGLVLIAVPLKRWADFPWAVKILGPIHGALFIMLIITLIIAVSKKAITKPLGTLIFLLAFIPFGAFYADYLLKKSQPTEDLQ